MAGCRRLSGASLREVLGEAQGVLFDCDGVLWTGERAVPGAPELLERLSRHGKAALFVSNNSRRSVAELERRFTRLGFLHVRGEQVFSSALCSALFLRQRLLGGEAGAGDSLGAPPGRVFVLGGEGLRGELRDAGLHLAGEGGADEPPVRAVLVGYDDQFTFAKLSKACAYLRDPQCLLVATDPDPWHPLSDGQRTPGECGQRAGLPAKPCCRLVIVGGLSEHVQSAFLPWPNRHRKLCMESELAAAFQHAEQAETFLCCLAVLRIEPGTFCMQKGEG